MINVAMLGFGGIAQTHKNAHLKFEKAGRERLVAICDTDPEAFTRRVKINIETGEPIKDGNYRKYTDLEEMLANEKIDLIDICLPSYLHAQYAVQLLERGYSIQSEKPMSLNSADCQSILDAWHRSGKSLMIGQCLRFYGEYQYLKQIVDDKRFGNVTSVLFQRLSGQPRWGYDQWYRDFNRSGSVICDMQIHDLDMARYLFGEPEYVECHASTKFVKYDYAQITLGYPFPVTSIGDWTLNGFKFQHHYRVGFEKASVVMESGNITVYPADGSTPYTPEDYPHVSGIEGEIDYYLNLLESGETNTKNPPESAAETIRLVETCWKSADMGGARIKF